MFRVMGDNFVNRHQPSNLNIAKMFPVSEKFYYDCLSYILKTNASIGNKIVLKQIPKSFWKNLNDYNDILSPQNFELLKILQKELKMVELKFNGSTKEAKLLLFNYDYTYNGYTVKAPFASSFSQISWLLYCTSMYIKFPNQLTYDELYSAVLAYTIPLEKGGFTAIFPDGTMWFEEIPTSPPGHILNAQIFNLIVLHNSIILLGAPELSFLVNNGRKALEDRFSEWYDCGNYARYDLHNKNYESIFKITPQIKINQKLGSHFNQYGGRIFVSRISPKRINQIANPAYEIITTACDAYSGASRLSGQWDSTSFQYNYKQEVSPTSNLYYLPDSKDKYNIKYSSNFIVEFPSEGQGDYSIEIEYFDAVAGDFSIEMRDPHAARGYFFDRVGEIKAKGDQRWKILTLPIQQKLLTGYIGPVYHMAHYHLLSLYQDTFNSDIFSDAIKGYGNYIKSQKGTDPFLQVNTTLIDLAKAKTTEINNLQLQPEPLKSINAKTIEYIFDKEYEIASINLKTPFSGLYYNTLFVEFKNSLNEKYKSWFSASDLALSRDQAYFQLSEPITARFIRVTYSTASSLANVLDKGEIEIFADPDILLMKQIINFPKYHEKDLSAYDLLEILSSIKHSKLRNIYNTINPNTLPSEADKKRTKILGKLLQKALSYLNKGSRLVEYALNDLEYTGIEVMINGSPLLI